MIYTRAILEAPGVVLSIRAQYFVVSGRWYRFLEFLLIMEWGIKCEWVATNVDNRYG